MNVQVSFVSQNSGRPIRTILADAEMWLEPKHMETLQEGKAVFICQGEGIAMVTVATSQEVALHEYDTAKEKVWKESLEKSPKGILISKK